jgi:hypothetical protein
MPFQFILTKQDVDKPLPPQCIDGTIWILKPGENTNQGRQIALYDKRLLMAKHVYQFFQKQTHKDASLIL